MGASSSQEENSTNGAYNAAAATAAANNVPVPVGAVPPTSAEVTSISRGWRVFCVFPNSPTSHLSIVPYFSILSHINDIELNANPSSNSLLSSLADGVAVRLTFTDLLTLQQISATVTPNKNWGGQGLLGMKIRYDQFANLKSHAIHVLEVAANSPAAVAGLVADSDYLLGSREVSFKSYGELDWWLSSSEGQLSQLFVFNVDTYTIREVNITPNRGWGGDGSLGLAKLGIGYLHELPLVKGIPVSLTSQEQHVDLLAHILQQRQPLPQQQLPQLQQTQHHQQPQHVQTPPQVTAESAQPPVAGPSAGSVAGPASPGTATSATNSGDGSTAVNIQASPAPSAITNNSPLDIRS